MADCIVYLSSAVDEKAVKIKKLLRMIFGASTEKKDNVIKKDDQNKSDPENTDGNAESDVDQKAADPAPSSKDKDKKEKASPKGHGRNGAVLERYVFEFPYQWYNFFDFWRQ